MHYKLPHYTSGHVAAILSVAALHGGLAVWQMMPAHPVAIPQQQVIQVSMVAPAAPREIPQPVAEAVPTPQLPPAVKGMQKMQPEAEPVPKKAMPPKKDAIAKPQPVTEMLASGMQPTEATQHHAALTEPVAADYLRNPPPVYPRAALRKRMQGVVMIEVRVGADGLPLLVSLERSSGHSALDKAALEAVEKWKFVPARRGSEVVEASVVVPVEFRIN